MASAKQQRFFYEAQCDNAGCDLKGTMQHYKSHTKKTTIKCVSCGIDLTLALKLVNLNDDSGWTEV